MSTKTITIQDVINAAEKNGLPYHSSWFKHDSGEIVAACILGQVAINLEVEYMALHNWINYGLNEDYGYDARLATKIESYNDAYILTPGRNGLTGYHRSYKTILKFLKRKLEPYKDQKYTLNTQKYNVRKPE